MKIILALNTTDTKWEHEFLTYLFGQVTQATGSYKGVKEASYIINLDNLSSTNFNNVKDLAKAFNQESILLVNDNAGYLAELYIIKTGEFVELGHFKPVGAVEPDTEAWTLINGEYYITRFEDINTVSNELVPIDL